MKKIPTLFKREFLDHHVINISPVLSSPDLAWVLAEEGEVRYAEATDSHPGLPFRICRYERH